MLFDAHPKHFTVVICPGPLYEDGVEVWATTHGRDILISGGVPPEDRTDSVVDQLIGLRELFHGPLCREGIASFVVDIMRQLNAQGGEAALRKMTAAAPSRRQRRAA